MLPYDANMPLGMRRKLLWFIENVCGFLLVFQYAESSQEELMTHHLSIGIIQNCGDNVTHDARRESYTTFGYVTQINIRCVDTSEVYQLLKAVLSFNDDGTDVIVLFDHDTSVTTDHILLEVNNTVVIQWDQMPSYMLKVPEVTCYYGGGDAHAHVSAGVHDCSLTVPRPDTIQPNIYCILDELYMTEESIQTLIDTVEVRGPTILTSLVVMNLHWSTLYIIHENATVHETTSLVDLLSTHGVLFVIYNIDGGSDLQTFLYDVYHAEVKSSTGIHFLVLCSINCVSRVFDTANHFDGKRGVRAHYKTILAQLPRWLVCLYYDQSGQDSDPLRRVASDLDNVAIVNLPYYHHGNQRHNFDVTLASILKEYDIRTHEPTIYEHRTLREFVVRNLTTRTSRRSPCNAYIIETLMWTPQGREFNTVGYVAVDGQVLLLHEVFPNTKFGYNKRRLLVSTLNYSPFVIKRMAINGTAEYDGICFELLKELARTLNFTYTITEPADKKWGAPSWEGENVTFNGLIGQLQREEVDMVAADISIQKEREMVMDFTFPFFYGQTSVLLKKPDPNKRKWRTLVDPLKVEVLFAIGVTLPVVSLVTFLLEKYNPFYSVPAHAREAAQQYGIHSFQDAFWYMYGALLCQGGINLPESMAGRTFVSCWWLFSIIIVGTYCGNLIAFLTVAKVKPPFDTLAQMAKMSDEYKWGTIGGTHWEYVFKNSTHPEFRAIGDKLFEFNSSDRSILSVDVDEHLRKVRAGGYAWIGDTVIIEVNLAKDCELMMIKEKFLPLKYAFGFPNNSPYTRIFSDQMISIHESGLLHFWKRRNWPKKNNCAGPVVTEATPISLIDVQSAFYVASGGMLIGFLAFTAEVMIAKYMAYRRKKGCDNLSRMPSRRGTPQCLTERALHN